MTTELSRRRLIGSGVGVAAGLPLAGYLAGCGDDEKTSSKDAAASTGPKIDEPRPTDADEALQRLLDGNARFVGGETLNLGSDTVRRAELAEGQQPFATILGCSDSRVPPEVVFDQGLGDLFTVRIAGNTGSDPLVVGSIEYSIEHLGSLLVMVLGHQSCGAVEAAVAAVTEGAEAPGSIGAVVKPIAPLVARTQKQDKGASEEQLVADSIKANVSHAVDELNATDPFLTHFVEDGKIKIVGAEYLLDTGEVKLI